MIHKTYPENIDSNSDTPLYYIGIVQWNDTPTLSWTLYKRQFLMSLQEWNERMALTTGFASPIMSRELHPWNLGGGMINTNKDCIDMNTEEFLKFMVDSLNKNV
jgi:hypothetical protein